MNILNSLEQSDYIVLVLGIVINLIVVVNTSPNSKKGVNNFILGYYFIVIFYNFFALDPVNLSNSPSFSLLLLVVLHFSKALILSISNEDLLIQCLNPLQIVLYFSLEVFFISKLYITYCYAIAIIIAPEIFLNVVFSIIFLFFQLLRQINNNFEVRSFQELYDRSFKFSESQIDKLEYSEPLLNYLTFLLFMEDRDFLSRKGYIFNPISIFLRKYLKYTDREIDDLNFDLLTKEKFASTFKKGFNSKDAVGLSRFFITHIDKLFQFFRKSSFRGYSTLPQQIVRVNTLKNFGTYDRFFIRRKFFVEFVYSTFFFSSLSKMYLQDSRFNYHANLNQISIENRTNLSKVLVKRAILFSYYGKLLTFPSCEEDLFKGMKTKAKTSKSMETLRNEWGNMENDYFAFRIKNVLYWDYFYYLESEIDFPKNLGL